MKLDAKVPAGPIQEKWDKQRFELKLVNPANKRRFDIIVVGSGLAGGSAAAALGELGYRVKCFCYQDSARRAHSIAAQGGINAADIQVDAASYYACEGYRLPTEAEWEYAARAWDGRATYNGDLDSGHLVCEAGNTIQEPIAWFCGNSVATPQPVAQLLPNAAGLYDMLGNVFEWCWDWYGGYRGGSMTDPTGPTSGGTKRLRGGGWFFNVDELRCSHRVAQLPTDMHASFGFRVVRFE